MLHEKTAPVGFNLAADIFFTVDGDGVIKITDADGNVLEDQSALTVTQETETIVVDEEKSYDIEYILYTVTMIDKSGYELPLTGGPGTKLFTLGGIALIAAAVIYGFGKRRRRERRSG